LDDESPEAALEALQEAAEVFVELMLERGEGVPIESVTSGTGEVILAVNVGVRSLVF
jgi:predicted RNase H-like HicB family nuclease